MRKPLLNRHEALGGLVFLALALLLLLVPAPRLAGGDRFRYVGQDLLAGLGAERLAVTVPALRQDVEAHKPGLKVVDLRTGALAGSGGLPGAVRLDADRIFDGYRELCTGAEQVLFYDATGVEGLAAQAALLFRLNDCPAVWLAGGLAAWSDAPVETSTAAPPRPPAPAAAACVIPRCPPCPAPGAPPPPTGPEPAGGPAPAAAAAASAAAEPAPSAGPTGPAAVPPAMVPAPGPALAPAAVPPAPPRLSPLVSPSAPHAPAASPSAPAEGC